MSTSKLLKKILIIFFSNTTDNIIICFVLISVSYKSYSRVNSVSSEWYIFYSRKKCFLSVTERVKSFISYQAPDSLAQNCPPTGIQITYLLKYHCQNTFYVLLLFIHLSLAFEVFH